MDPQFTERLQEWVNTPDSEKDWDEGAVLLLQLSGNKIMYHNIAVNPKGKAEFIKGKLKKYLDFRLQKLTHEEVQQMQQQVNEIVASRTEFKEPEKNPATEFRAGKRADHDQLPEEIQALYTENLDITNRMRELHLRLRMLSTEDATCPDSERYPFLKEFIAYDKKLHAKWDDYDHYVNVPESTTAGQTEAAQAEASLGEGMDRVTDWAEGGRKMAAKATAGSTGDAGTAGKPDDTVKATARKSTRKASAKKGKSQQ